jgi:hypothetical protein
MDVKNNHDLELLWQSAFKRIVWYGDLHGFEDIASHADSRGINLVGIDMNPEIQLAANYAKNHPIKSSGIPIHQVFPFYQTALKGESMRVSVRDVQGTPTKCFALHRSFGLDAVKSRIYRNLQSFPVTASYVAGDQNSLLYHYLSSERTRDGLWKEIGGAPDHWFHADNFTEVAVLAYLLCPEDTGSFTSITV